VAKLFLHVGFHKTGTTSLQGILNRNRKELLDQGFSYPKTKKFKAHHEFAWSVGERGWGWKKFGGSQAGTGPAKRMYKFLKNSKQDVVLSSEFLSELKQEHIQTMVSRLSDRELRVIFTIRPIAKILPSAYQQEVKNGSRLTYNRWLRRVLDQSGENRNKTRFWSRHSHHVEIAKWADIIGRDKITVIVSDDGRPEFLSQAFFELIGASSHHFKEANKEIINRSMDLAEIELLRQVNEKFDRELGWDEYVADIRSTFVKTWTQREPSENSPGRLANPEIFREEINNRAVEIAEGIKLLGVEILGDLDSLSKASYGSNSTPTLIEIQNLVEPILSRTRQSTLDSYKTSQLAWLVAKRVAEKLRRELRHLLRIKKRAV
jgi:hypothetical protein